MVSFYIHTCLESEYLAEYCKVNKTFNGESNNSKQMIPRTYVIGQQCFWKLSTETLGNKENAYYIENEMINKMINYFSKFCIVYLNQVVDLFLKCYRHPLPNFQSCDYPNSKY